MNAGAIATPERAAASRSRPSRDHRKHRTIMRSIAVAGTVLALTGLGAAPALAHQTTRTAAETERQHGIVLECTGDADGLAAYVYLYENDKHVTYFQGIVDDDPN